MRKLFKHLKPYATTIAVIVMVLIVQAYCDLSLPSYTSDIVNVGIQQGGIDEDIPDAIAEKEMDKLLLFVSEKISRRCWMPMRRKNPALVMIMMALYTF